MLKNKKNLIAVIGKIVVAGILVAAIIPVMTMVRFKDSMQNPTYCATCHDDPHYVTWNDAEKQPLAFTHYQSAISCQRCHGRTLDRSLEEINIYNEDYLRDFGFEERMGSLLNMLDEDTNESVFLMQTEMEDEFCTNCHSNDNARIAATENYTVEIELGPEFVAKLAENGNQSMVDEKMEPFNPHTYGVDTFDIEDPHREGVPMLECQSCHIMHEDVTSMDYCFSCHHSRTLFSCSVCHEEVDPVSNPFGL